MSIATPEPAAARPPRATALRHLETWLLGLGRSAWLFPLDLVFRTVGIRYGWLKALFQSAPPKVLAITGRLRAERAAWRATHRVPAFRAYLNSVGTDPDDLVPAGILTHLPETDKGSYIDPYSLARRCVDGRIPFPGVTIDE